MAVVLIKSITVHSLNVTEINEMQLKEETFRRNNKEWDKRQAMVETKWFEER